MGEHRAVGEFHQAVHDALRVEHGVALVGLQPEEALGLDQLQALVGERGGIDGDLGAHRPVRVADRVGGSDRRQTFGRPVAEGAAARGEDDAPHARLRVAFQALEDGVVLAVDRQKPPAVLSGRGQDELSGEHEDFLGGEGEILAGRQCRQRGFKAGRADHGDEHDVGLREPGELVQAIETPDDPGPRGKGGGLGFGGGEGLRD